MHVHKFPVHVELRRNGEESPSDQGGVRFYSSSGIINTWTGGEIPYIFDRQFLTGK